MQHYKFELLLKNLIIYNMFTNQNSSSHFNHLNFTTVLRLDYGQNLFAALLIFHASATHYAIQYDRQQNNSTSMRNTNFCNAIPYILVEI